MMKEKECEICGVLFIPKHGRATQCRECRDAIQNNKGRGLPRSYDVPGDMEKYERGIRDRWLEGFRGTIVAEGYVDRQRAETLRNVPKIEPHL